MNQGRQKKFIWLRNFIEQFVAVIDGTETRIDTKKFVENKVGWVDGATDYKMGVDRFEGFEGIGFLEEL